MVVTLAVRSEYYGVRDELTGDLQLCVYQLFLVCLIIACIIIFPLMGPVDAVDVFTTFRITYVSC